MRVQEESTDLKRRGPNLNLPKQTEITERLDLQKVYPRTSKPALCKILRRNGHHRNFPNCLKDLYESTTYAVKVQGGYGDPLTPERGLRGMPYLTNIVQHIPLGSDVRSREEKKGTGNHAWITSRDKVALATYHETESPD